MKPRIVSLMYARASGLNGAFVATTPKHAVALEVTWKEA